jgi:hypothetical protein
MVHHIARDTLGFILQKNGQDILIHNLNELSNFFRGTSELIRESIVEITSARGINQELIDKLVSNAFSANIEPLKSPKE